MLHMRAARRSNASGARPGRAPAAGAAGAASPRSSPPLQLGRECGGPPVAGSAENSEGQRLHGVLQVGAPSITGADVTVREAAVARAEQPLAQRARLLALGRQPAPSAEFRHHELREIAGRVERVVLTQVDAIESVFVEP